MMTTNHRSFSCLLLLPLPIPGNGEPERTETLAVGPSAKAYRSKGAAFALLARFWWNFRPSAFLVGTRLLDIHQRIRRFALYPTPELSACRQAASGLQQRLHLCCLHRANGANISPATS